METVTIIPARLASKRFPGKPLADIAGKPMILWVYERAKKALTVSRTLVATEDPLIHQVVLENGGEAIMTANTHRTGTDRVAEVAASLSADIIVNVQGDEPLVDPGAIDRAVSLVREGFPMASVMAPLRSTSELHDPNIVKVVVDKNRRALYFSRFPIPHSRFVPDGAFGAFRHVGLYVYRRETLLKLSQTPVSLLEEGEALEQLRALELGLSIGMAYAENPGLGVDTPEDLEQAKRLLLETCSHG